MGVLVFVAKNFFAIIRKGCEGVGGDGGSDPVCLCKVLLNSMKL